MENGFSLSLVGALIKSCAMRITYAPVFMGAMTTLQKIEIWFKGCFSRLSIVNVFQKGRNFVVALEDCTNIWLSLGLSNKTLR